jgi:predicted ATPase
MFSKISIDGWRQFRHIDINFHPRLTVLTGANGAGKTTILSLISRHLGWGVQYIGTPGRRRAGSSSLEYSADLWDFDSLQASNDENQSSGVTEASDGAHRQELSSADIETLTRILEERRQRGAAAIARRNSGPMTVIGSITYSTGQVTPLAIQTSGTQHVYDVQIQAQQHVEGVHIPSHRSVSVYQQVQNIPTVPRRRGDVFNQYVQLVRTRFQGQHTQWSPLYYMKETLIALATFGYGNSAVEADAESAKVFEEFQAILGRMLPPSLGFRRLVVKIPEVVLETDTGDFAIDALSGGASAVLELAWQIFMFQPTGDKFVVTLDEPENHLHPALQRRVLSDLLAAFPNVQFIVATHSPFIVGSVPDSAVYALAYDKSSSVVSHLLDTANKAGSANDILRQVLGVDITIPIWAEEKIRQLVHKYSERDFSRELVAELRIEMRSLGLDVHTPQAIAQLAEKKDQE